MSAYLLLTALDGLVASGCVGLAIALCATRFPALALLSRAAVVAKLGLHALSLLLHASLLASSSAAGRGLLEVRLVWDCLHLALVALYAFSRVTSSSSSSGGDSSNSSPAGLKGMDVLDWAFVAFAGAGHAADLAGRVAVRAVVVPRLFERYLASFEVGGVGGGGEHQGKKKKQNKNTEAGTRGGVAGWLRGLFNVRSLFGFKSGLGLGFGKGRRRRKRRRKGGRGGGEAYEYGYAGQVLDQDSEQDPEDRVGIGMKGYGRTEQHLLGDMERLV